MQITHNIALDMAASDTVRLPSSLLTVGDTVHTLKIQLQNINTVDIGHVTINLVRPDGQYVTGQAATIDNDIITYDLTSTDLAISGYLMANVHLYAQNGDRVATPVIAIHVIADLANEKAIESVEQYTILQDLIKQVEGLTNIDLGNLNFAPATPTEDGLMSALDKAKLDSLEQITDYVTTSSLADLQAKIAEIIKQKANQDDLDALSTLCGDLDAALSLKVDTDTFDNVVQDMQQNIDDEIAELQDAVQTIDDAKQGVQDNLLLLNDDIKAIEDTQGEMQGELSLVHDDVQHLTDSQTAMQGDIALINDKITPLLSKTVIQTTTTNPVAPVIGQMWMIISTGGEA